MAAVLCKSIGELCALPFKCCAAGCKGCNDVCGGACKGVCRGCDEFFKLLCRNPFSLFVAVALFTQGPAVFLVIPAVGGIPDCTESMYLVANSVLAAVNVFTAFYLAYRIVDTSNQQMGDTAFKRATWLLCNDPWIAIYICLYIGFMCVQAWGSSLSLFGSNDIPADDQICPEQAGSMVWYGTSLGWTFCFLGFGALLFSLCCAKFDNTDYSQPANNTNTNNTNPSVPHGSYDAPQNNGANAAYNAQGVPNNDFVQPEQPQQGGKYSKPAASNAPMYNQQGVPTNDFVANEPPRAQAPPPQEEVPMAYAEHIPQASAPPSQYDNAGRGDNTASQANNNNNTNNTNTASSSTGAKVGGTAGKQIGKMFSKDQAQQEKIAQQGQKAGETLETGLLAAKKFLFGKKK
mmetsp:Transcript_34396/g.83481  ORF Transcript_34396/g.83481 Transcript_34396/m.83481 type:complete len:404 (-) Transcript_34396:1232-2443(-)